MCNNTKPENEAHPGLLEVARQIMSSLFDLEKVLNLLANQAKALMPVDSVTIALIHGENLLKVETTDSLIIDLTPTFPAYLAGKGLAGKVLRTGQIMTTSDYWNDASIERSPDIDKTVRKANGVASMAVPIKLNAQIVALLWLSHTQPYQWQQSDYYRAEQFAELAALTLHNARLYQRLDELNQKLDQRNQEQLALLEATQEAAEALEIRNQELEILQNFNRRLRGPVELQSTAARALELAIELVGADGGRIWMQDKHEPEKLNLLLRVGFKNSQTQSQSITIWHGLAGKVVRTQQSIMTNNMRQTLEQDKDIIPLYPPQAASGLFVPLFADDKIIGVLVLLAAEINHFSLEQLHFAETLANQIGIAIWQVSQRQLQKERDQLAAALALARTAAHDLSQPLTFLQAELDFALELGDIPTIETLEKMQTAVSIMSKRLLEYQKIARFQTTEPVEGIAVLDMEANIRVTQKI